MRKRTDKSQPATPKSQLAKGDPSATGAIEVNQSDQKSGDTPFPTELAQLAVQMAGGGDALQFLDAALDLWEAARSRIERQRLERANSERTALEKARGEWLVARRVLHEPITLAEMVSMRLLPKALGEKGAEIGAQPYITSEKGIVKSLREFFEKCRPVPPPPDQMSANLSFEARLNPSQEFLAEVLKQRKLPFALFQCFLDWRSSRKDPQATAQQHGDAGETVAKGSPQAEKLS